MYRIEIKKVVADPDFEKKLVAYNERARYGTIFDQMPTHFSEQAALSTELTDEEFEIVRNEILKQWDTKTDPERPAFLRKIMD